MKENVFRGNWSLIYVHLIVQHTVLFDLKGQNDKPGEFFEHYSMKTYSSSGPK